MSQHLEILQGMRGLLAAPKRWIQGAHAQTRFGSRVEANSPDAACWCLEGAFLRTVKTDTSITHPTWRFLNDVASDMGLGLLVDFNDRLSTVHAAVLAVLDRAIQLAEAMEKGAGDVP